MSELIKVKIDGLALDVTTNSPVIILKPDNDDPDDQNKVLPIWIGHYEAWAIGMEMSGVVSKRPLTHDLLYGIVKSMGGEIEKIVVTELKEQTFFAKILITHNGSVIEVDARPSDSTIPISLNFSVIISSLIFILTRTLYSSSACSSARILKFSTISLALGITSLIRLW